MSSRLWLAVAFVLAAGASPARAETSMIAVTLDQAKIARLPHGTATLIVGNPMIADVTMLKNNDTMIITGKGFGQTNLIAIDGAGSLIEEQQIQVLPAKTVLVLQNGNSRISYACNPACMPTVQLGDDDKIFKDDRRTDLDPQRLRRGRLGNSREIRRVDSALALKPSRKRASPPSSASRMHQPRSLKSSRWARVERPAARVKDGFKPDIDLGDERGNRLRAIRKRVQDRGFPLAPVMAQRAQIALRFDDGAAVAGPIDRLGARRAACRASPYRRASNRPGGATTDVDQAMT